MLDAFKQHIEQIEFDKQNTSILVGYSGGADSTCLLHLLSLCGFNIVAAHLHHGMRPEADFELEQCTTFADSLGIPFVSGRADVPGISRQLKVGIEEAGRHARQLFYRQSAFQTDCQLIATGHTQDDQVETILMNIFRGTGLTGLVGIHALKDSFWRPLLPFTRKQTRSYCEQNNLWFHDDPGNFNEDFTRVRVRRRLIPEIEAINPSFASALSRASEIIAGEDEFLNQQAAQILEQSERKLNGHLNFLTNDTEVSFHTQKLAHYPRPLLLRAIRMAAVYLGAELTFNQTITICNSIVSGTHCSVTSEGGEIVIEVSPDQTVVRNIVEFEPFRFPLTIPGETESEVFGWKFTIQSTPPSEFKRDVNSLDVVIDHAKIVGNLHFRSVQSGDELVPLGEQRSKKVSELLAKAKLTSAARRRLPIICDMVGPIWIPGVRLSDRAKVTSETNRALLVQFEPL